MKPLQTTYVHNLEAIQWANDLSWKARDAEEAGNHAEAEKLREEAMKVRQEFGLCDELADGEGLDD
jgi:hypothetical protein